MTQLEEGAILEGKVTGITNFGAFVAMPGGQSGLVHISEIADTYVKDVHDHLQVGQAVRVKVLGFGNGGKINLSIKKAVEAAPAPRRSQPPVRVSAPAVRSATFGMVPPAQGPSGDAVFEDKLRHFMQESDSRISDSRQRENRRNNRRRRS